MDGPELERRCHHHELHGDGLSRRSDVLVLVDVLHDLRPHERDELHRLRGGLERSGCGTDKRSVAIGSAAGDTDRTSASRGESSEHCAPGDLDDSDVYRWFGDHQLWSFDHACWWRVHSDGRSRDTN